MTQRRTTRRRRSTPIRQAVRAVGVLLLIVAGSAVLAPPAPAQPVNARSVTVSIVDVSPTTPLPTTAPAPLVVTMSLTNNTDQTMADVLVRGARSNPITTRSALDEAIGRLQPPDPNQVSPIVTKKPVTTVLGPRGTTTVTFTTSTSTDSSSGPGLCLCQTRIYPLYFSVLARDAGGNDVLVGAAQTFVPSFTTVPTSKVRVGWVWPIIDRPHRLVGDTVFTDDELAYLIAGGRLDRVLSVVEQVARHSLAMTLVIDPELIDELAVMATGSYTVAEGGKSTPGTGTAAARVWLERLRNALAADPSLQVDFTPLADPDVESLSRNGLQWTTGLPAQVQSRVSAALAGRTLVSAVGWPADGLLSSPTLNQLVRNGAGSVIVSDAALPSTSGPGSTANQLGILQTPAGQVTADVTQRSIQRYVDTWSVLPGGAAGQSALLVAEVAVAAMSASSSSPFVTIAAPREVNPVPDVAAQAILDTANTFWSSSITLDEASHTVVPSDHGPLAIPKGNQGRLSDLTIDDARTVSRVVPALATMMSAVDASVLLGSLPAAVQRAESSAWRTLPGQGDAFASALTTHIDAIESGVRIVQPSAGTYTLTSSNSPLPITVENNLDVTVKVRVEVTSENDLPGFTANEAGLQTIAPNTKVTLHVPTHVDRTGRFRVQAVLVTPSNVRIGDRVLLTVHSTALGTIGVIITVGAAVVLVVALLVRLFRRLRRRRRVAPPGAAA